MKLPSSISLLGFAAILGGANCAPHDETSRDESGSSFAPAEPGPIIVATMPNGDRIPLPAPPLFLSPADLALFAPLPTRADAIPVLLFHGVCPVTCSGDDIYELPRAEFARMMLMVAHAGYTSISPNQYSRFMSGDKRGLPVRPILVTFDDGRIDAYLSAHEILGATGTRATMFVITDRPELVTDGFMRWTEIRSALATGRWDIQLHAGSGHVKVPSGVDLNGAIVLAPFYASRLYDAVAYPQGGHLETLDAWRTRSEGDIAGAGALMTARVHNYFHPWTFAVPFGDYGQINGNDPAIAPTMRAYLDANFDYWFTQPIRDPDFTVPSGTTHERYRKTVLNAMKAEDIYAWLKVHATPAGSSDAVAPDAGAPDAGAPDAGAPVTPSPSPRWTSPSWIDYDHHGPGALRLPEYSSAGFHHGDMTIPTKQLLVVEASDFGALPNDNLDDTAALQAALDSVGQAGGGVVHLPVGRFIVHPTTASPTVTIRYDNVVLRGSGSGPSGTVLYLGAPGVFNTKDFVFPRAGSSVDDPQKQAALAIIGSPARTELARYAQSALRGSNLLHVTTTSGLRAGQTVQIELRSTPTDTPDLPHLLTAPASIFPDKEFDTVSSFGETISWFVEIAQVVDGTTVLLTQPLRFDHNLAQDPRIYSFEGVAGAGVEHLRFDSAWAGGFSHHKPFPWLATGTDIVRTVTEQDYLWSAIWVSYARDGWMTDVNIANYTQGINFSRSTAFTVDYTRREGLDGHAGIHLASSHNILIRNYEVASHVVHFVTIEAWASGNVITASTCDQTTTDLPTQTGPFIDFHGLFAYENLIENTHGCYLFPGGDRQVLPQAGIRNTFWNMEVPAVMDRLGVPFLNEFFRSDSWDLTAGDHPFTSYQHYPQSFVVAPFRGGLPIQVGGSTADRKDSWLTLEGMGRTFVNPTSLYGAQLARRQALPH